MPFPPPTRGLGRPRLAIAVTAVVTALLLAACDAGVASPGAETPAAPPDGSPAASPGGSPAASPTDGSPQPVAGEPDEDPCALVPADAASALLEADVTALTVDTPVGPACRYVPAQGGSGFVVATIHTSEDAAEDPLAEAIEALSLGEMPGVGDAAAGIPGTLFVRSGDIVFSIVAADSAFQPVPEEQLADAAREAVERLGGTNAPVDESPSPSPEASPS